MHLRENKRKLVFLTRLLAVFLLALSFADHDDRIFIGEDYQSAAVEALDYDHVDFPTSISRNDSPSYGKIHRAILLPLAQVFNLELFKKIEPSITFPPQLSGIHAPLQFLLELIVCSNAP
jgi:hypothetical protein